MATMHGVQQLITDLVQRLPGPAPDAALKRELAREARYFSDVIIKKMTQLGICYRYPKSQKDFTTSGVQRLKFRRAVTTSEGIYLEIDTVRLPRGVSLADIDDEKVLRDLSIACQRPIRYREGVESGAWLIIERASGFFGILRNLPYADVVETWPKSSNKALLVPLGVGENKRLVFRSLAEMPHALVGGSTGAGKTTLLHAWACALLTHNSPRSLRIAFIDLKGGIEASFYRGVPHILPHGIISDKADVVNLLQRLYAIMEERLSQFGAAGVQNIAAWNYRNRGEGHLYRVVLMIDEMANIMLDPSIKKDAQSLLADITARGRAPGVHVIVSTQRPEVAVVPGLIKANLDARCGFRCTDNPSSMVILDDTSAAQFPGDTPPGRFVYKRGLDRSIYQAPLITAGQIKEIVRAVADGKAEEAEASRISPEDVFKKALELDGSFSIRGLYKAFEGQASQNYLRRLGEEYEGQIVEIDGQPYVLNPSNGGNQPRSLSPVPTGDPPVGESMTRNT